MSGFGATVVVLPAVGGDKLRFVGPVVQNIEKHKGQIQLIGGHDLRRDTVCLVLGLRLGCSCRQFVQHADLAFALYFRGRFLHRVEQTADPSVVPRDRAVRKREVGFLGHSLVADE